MNIKVNKLSSTKTQLPYEYYSLPFCRPPFIINSAENLGEVLRGDRIENSVFTVRARAAPAAGDSGGSRRGARVAASSMAQKNVGPGRVRLRGSAPAWAGGEGAAAHPVHSSAATTDQ